MDGIVDHYKEKEKNKKPEKDDYERLLQSPFLERSDHLNFLADNVKEDYQIDAIFEHMNRFRGDEKGTDIYEVKSYWDINEKLMKKKGW